MKNWRPTIVLFAIGLLAASVQIGCNAKPQPPAPPQHPTQQVARESMIAFAQGLGGGYLDLAAQIRAGQFDNDEELLAHHNFLTKAIRQRAFMPVFEATELTFNAPGSDGFDRELRANHFQRLGEGFLGVK